MRVAIARGSDGGGRGKGGRGEGQLIQFQTEFHLHRAMEVVAEVIKTSRAAATKPAIVLSGSMHSMRVADTIEEKTNGYHCLVVPNTTKKSQD